MSNREHRKEAGGNRNVALAIDHISKTYPVSFLRLKKLLRRRFKPPVEALCDVTFNVHEAKSLASSDQMAPARLP